MSVFRSTIVAAAVLSFLTAMGAGAQNAPREGSRQPGRWASGLKNYFGTSYDADGSERAKKSRVWFTGANHVSTEIYWPTLDRPQTRDTQILAVGSDGQIFEESKNSISKTTWIETGVPAFVTVNKDPGV